jgi:radical SAM superfamily enzyme YgiQ (UPF0313 family)
MIALVDSSPVDMRNTGSVNLGYEIVRDTYSADALKWRDKIDHDKYDLIGINVFYPTNVINAARFIINNNLPKNKVIVGGQGIGINKLMSPIANEFIGEIDWISNRQNINSEMFVKGNNAVIELTRGCKYKCKFCEYSWVHSTSYREKELGLVKEQMLQLKKYHPSIKSVNFLSANFAGYSRIDELFLLCRQYGISIKNSDICIFDAHKVLPHLQYLPRYLKVGIESFDEKTRLKVGKGISNNLFWSTVESLLQKCSGIHFYLIYGLPQDDYNEWQFALCKLGSLRRSFSTPNVNLFNDGYLLHRKQIRFEFSITNFEPCPGTPMENDDYVNFTDKGIFLKDLWFPSLEEYGFLKYKDNHDYKNMSGRLGRKELSYLMLMALKNGGPEIIEEVIYAFPKGIGRSISDSKALKFLQYPN